MNSNKGFTLTELLVTIVIGGLMMLTMGSISEIGKRSHRKLLRESGGYNDIAYGFKLVRNKVHKTRAKDLKSVTILSSSTTWVPLTERLELGATEKFGIYNEAGNKMSFVYVNGSGSRQTILEADSLDMVIEPEIFVDKVEITLSGIKDGISFSRTILVTSRRL